MKKHPIAERELADNSGVAGRAREPFPVIADGSRILYPPGIVSAVRADKPDAFLRAARQMSSISDVHALHPFAAGQGWQRE